MERHFCTCSDLNCPSHPCNHNEGCDPCIKKNLELGEVPSCIWNNVLNVTGTTDYSAENFAKFVVENRNKQ